jgi:hypothetical protein
MKTTCHFKDEAMIDPLSPAMRLLVNTAFPICGETPNTAQAQKYVKCLADPVNIEAIKEYENTYPRSYMVINESVAAPEVIAKYCELYNQWQAQVEREIMFELLAKNGPMEVSPGGEIRKIKE